MVLNKALPPSGYHTVNSHIVSNCSSMFAICSWMTGYTSSFYRQPQKQIIGIIIVRCLQNHILVVAGYQNNGRSDPSLMIRHPRGLPSPIPPPLHHYGPADRSCLASDQPRRLSERAFYWRKGPNTNTSLPNRGSNDHQVSKSPRLAYTFITSSRLYEKPHTLWLR